MKPAKWGLTLGLAIAAIALAACGDDEDGGGGDPTAENQELFTSAGFQKAYDAVVGETGENAELLQIQITTGGASFQLKSGEDATGFVYTGGELHSQRVDIIGPGSIEGIQYPISDVDPAAIDKIVDGIESESDVSDITVTVMTLEKGSIDEKPRWTMNAEGGGRTGLVYTADLDGSNVTSPLGDVAGGGTDTGGGATAPRDRADAVAQCVQEAQGDVAKIQACVQ